MIILEISYKCIIYNNQLFAYDLHFQALEKTSKFLKIFRDCLRTYAPFKNFPSLF